MGFTSSTTNRVIDVLDLNRSGKDSFEQRPAGACEVMPANWNRWALLHEVRILLKCKSAPQRDPIWIGNKLLVCQRRLPSS